MGSTVELRGDLAEVERELLRVLAPDGRVALLVPLDRDLPGGLEVVVEERVRVSGAVARLVVLARSDAEHDPFDTTGLYGRELTADASSPARQPSL